MDETHITNGTLAELDDDTTQRLHDALNALSCLVENLWFLGPHTDEIDDYRTDADDIIASILAGMRPPKEAIDHAK